MSDFKLTEEQQVIMDELVREAKAARQRLDSSEWQAKNRRRIDLLDIPPKGLTEAAAAELKAIEDEFCTEYGLIQAPDLYNSALRLVRRGANIERLKAEQVRANT